ncbi:dihydroneopterin triphosphate pyrophosphatase [mine drainage metagenome]|uniref:Dihydroneopterin triphosphate pyrophosphatase n=1 Tax=mine drainage metagenome TaxID=410659 RepID=A0A1J5QSW9_9ZZZZ
MTGDKLPCSVLVVIHTPALDVLLIERARQPGFWQSVTGSIDHPGELLRDTARREVLEETGIAVGSDAVPESALRDWRLCNVYEIYPTWRHRYAAGVWKNVEHVWGLQVPAGTPVRLSPREHRAARWLPWSDAAAACFSASNAEAIRQLPRRLGRAP